MLYTERFTRSWRGCSWFRNCCVEQKKFNSIKAHRIIIFQARADNLAVGLVIQARHLGTPAMLIDGKSNTGKVVVPVLAPVEYENADKKLMAQDQGVVTTGKSRSRILAVHDWSSC